MKVWRLLKHTRRLASVPRPLSCVNKDVYSRTLCSHAASDVVNTDELKTEYDAIIVGAGHNGLVAAAYLQKAGLDVCVLERRHVIGGAAVTEEIIPGFKFSRASYVLSLLRPQIMEDLELKKHGLKVYLRNPNSYTPLLNPINGAKSLILSRNEEENKKQISQFSQRDAEAFPLYEEELGRMVEALESMLDSPPVNVHTWTDGSFLDKWNNRRPLTALSKAVRKLGSDSPAFYELLTAPASKVLDKWFESEPLKATLATDSVIGAMTSPKLPGSGYVLLHHVMGELEGIKGAWGYVEGGMGNVSMAIARSARSHGTKIFSNKPVKEMCTNGDGEVTGVVLEDGVEVKAKLVLSNATPKVTFLDLIPQKTLPEDFVKAISYVDYTSPVTKINVAVSRLPNFLADPNEKENFPGPPHMGTIHLNCEDSAIIHDAYMDAQEGKPSSKPVIEMTIPSSVDPTVSPEGAHVVQLFTQYTPYTLTGGKEWDDITRTKYSELIFDTIEMYAPGFKSSIVGYETLTPPDLERIFGLTGGNIFHGAMSLDQLYFTRPISTYCDQRTPIKGLYLCGSGAHPGGGVMGSPGRLAALTALEDFKK